MHYKVGGGLCSQPVSLNISCRTNFNLKKKLHFAHTLYSYFIQFSEKTNYFHIQHQLLGDKFNCQ